MADLPLWKSTASCSFFNDTAPAAIYTLSLHDALPISRQDALGDGGPRRVQSVLDAALGLLHLDRKSTRLNSSHTVISYAVFCLKKKTVEQIYLYGNPLLHEPLKIEHIQPRLLGHWGMT